jgi:hypothetical protein
MEFRKMQRSYFCGYTEDNSNTSREHCGSNPPLGIIGKSVKSHLFGSQVSHLSPPNRSLFKRHGQRIAPNKMNANQNPGASYICPDLVRTVPRPL